MAERVNWKHLAIAVVLAGGGGVGGAKILHGETGQAPAAAPATPDALAGAISKAFAEVLTARDERVRPSTDPGQHAVLDAITALRTDVQAIRDEVKGVRTEALQSASSLRVEIQAQAGRIDRVLEVVKPR